MYGGKGGGELIAPIVPTVGGIVLLPNTGGNNVLLAISLFSTIVGSAILLTTAVRLVAKKYYKV